MSDDSTNNIDAIPNEETINSLTNELIEAKVELAVLRKEKRQLVDELHRQFMDGEIEPKKRFKPYFDRRKKQTKSS
jgi:hypothetical protein